MKKSGKLSYFPRRPYIHDHLSQYLDLPLCLREGSRGLHAIPTIAKPRVFEYEDVVGCGCRGQEGQADAVRTNIMEIIVDKSCIQQLSGDQKCVQ